MSQSGCIRLMLLWLIVHCMVYGVSSSHFRGGIFVTGPKSGGTEREVAKLKLCILMLLFSCVYVASCEWLTIEIDIKSIII